MTDEDGERAVRRFHEFAFEHTPEAHRAAAGELGMRRPEALTKRYFVENDDGFWLVGYVQANGLVTVHTSEGSWGHWWSHHGCETILHWLARSGLHDLEYYIPSKLSGGRTEYDAEATHRGIDKYLREEAQRIRKQYAHAHLVRLRSERERLLKERDRERRWLRHERDLLRRLSDSDGLHRENTGEWHAKTKIQDASGFFESRYPSDLTRMLKGIWPAFIEAIRRDIGWQPSENHPTPTASASSTAK